MTKLLLAVHVLAAIIAIGPVTVAASMFPAATRRALAGPADQRSIAVLRNLHRICRVYAALGVLVPVFGLATAGRLGVLADVWLIISMVLTAAAAAVLAFLILPGQAAVLRDLAAPVSTATPGDETDRESPTAGHAADRRQAMHQPAADRRPAVTAAVRAEVAPATGAADRGRGVAARLGMVTGIFNLLWAVVVVLMIVRPGSTTGV